MFEIKHVFHSFFNMWVLYWNAYEEINLKESDQLKILHIGKFFHPVQGGMEQFLADIIEAQKNQGMDVRAIVHGDPLPEDPSWLVRVPFQVKLISTPIALGFGKALKELIEKFKPDILHLHMPNASVFYLLRIAEALNIPWVVQWQSDVVFNKRWGMALAYQAYRFFESAVLRQAQKIIVTSPPYLEESDTLNKWRDKCVVVPLGIKCDSGSECEKSENFELSNSPLISAWAPSTQLKLLSIGRLVPYKGFDLLTRAVLGMPGVELLIVGSGPLQAKLQEIIDACPDSDGGRVRLLGAVDFEKKNKLLQECDVFCLASIMRSEAFGVVLLEAMQFGRPCLVTDLKGSGMPWVVKKAQCGICIPTQDVNAWRTAIHLLMNDASLREKLGTAGRKSLVDYFDIASCAKNLADQYKEMSLKSLH